MAGYRERERERGRDKRDHFHSPPPFIVVHPSRNGYVSECGEVDAGECGEADLRTLLLHLRG